MLSLGLVTQHMQLVRGPKDTLSVQNTSRCFRMYCAWHGEIMEGPWGQKLLRNAAAYCLVQQDNLDTGISFTTKMLRRNMQKPCSFWTTSSWRPSINCEKSPQIPRDRTQGPQDTCAALCALGIESPCHWGTVKSFPLSAQSSRALLLRILLLQDSCVL